ncbi:MAG: hypothetical protein BSR46_17375 [Candidatus Dactylopiibacterium carminicum]|nr:PilN domain-containing protein [Candidatus Dactylopiibacterium carminicum]PAS94512.1 MAG: hypothetical protein BSR46_17375 [Candidatus Dactylopiibacterium carminicum]
MKPQINLVSAALLPPRPFFQFQSLVLYVAAAIVILLLFSFFIHGGLSAYEASAHEMQARVAQRETQVQTRERQLQPRLQDPAVAASLAHAQAEQQGLNAVLEALHEPEAAALKAAALFDALGDIPPGRVWLTGIDLVRGHVSLQGLATESSAIPAYLTLLGQQPALHGQSFTTFELGRQRFGDGPGAPEAVKFSLTARPEGKP